MSDTVSLNMFLVNVTFNDLDKHNYSLKTVDIIAKVSNTLYRNGLVNQVLCILIGCLLAWGSCISNRIEVFFKFIFEFIKIYLGSQEAKKWVSGNVMESKDSCHDIDQVVCGL